MDLGIITDVLQLLGSIHFLYDFNMAKVYTLTLSVSQDWKQQQQQKHKEWSQVGYNVYHIILLHYIPRKQSLSLSYTHTHTHTRHLFQ